MAPAFPWRAASSSQACRHDSASRKRALAFLASICMTRSEPSFGTAGLSFDGGGGWYSRCLVMISKEEWPTKGFSPVSAKYAVTPSE